MTSQDAAISWLGLSLQDWTNIAMIFGTVATLIVALAALLVSVAALRSQREALPMSVNFGFTGRGYVDECDGVRWLAAWMQNTGVTAYAHEVYRYEWEPVALREEQLPDVARVGVPDSMPVSLRSKSKHELRERAGVFDPGDLPSGQYSMFYVSCPPGVERVKLAVTMSIKRRSQIRFISSEWLDVPSAEEVIASTRETRGYCAQQARSSARPDDHAEGTGE